MKTNQNKNASYTGQIDLWTHDTRIAADRVLKELGLAESVLIHEYTGGRSWRYDVPAITAEQYGMVIDALSAIGEPGVDWNFPLD